MRRLIAFPCEGEALVGTLDNGSGRTGLLIVSGGNEIRIGAHRGMALLAQRLAERGVPVFRFDRRGIGDSTGKNHGFLSSARDISAAAATFRRESEIDRIVGFGNCDAATALALFGATAGVDAVVLANPWVIEPTDDLPPAAAIRARYAEKLGNSREWWRLLRGGVNIIKLFNGLQRVVTTSNEAGGLSLRVCTALRAWRGNVTVLLASKDVTAIAYTDAVKLPDLPTERLATASHSFAHAGDAAWLEERIIAALTYA